MYLIIIGKIVLFIGFERGLLQTRPKAINYKQLFIKKSV